MKFLSKKSCLSLALLASMSLVGCGGGGGSSDIPPGPDSKISTSAKAVQNSVTPVFNNADSILGISAAVRAALDADVEIFDKDVLGAEIAKAMDLGSILRLAVDIGGGNIKGGMFTSEGNDEKSDCFYVAKYANNVYEKSVYKKVDGKKVSLIGNYKVNGCDATVKDGIITAMTVRDGAAGGEGQQDGDDEDE